VEDGIQFLKSYAYISIHPRCKHMAQEARLYSYEVDKRNGDVLPKVADKHNHCWDSVRYGHDGIITRSGAMGVWKKLAKG
jgi:phage terminase large subunit